MASSISIPTSASLGAFSSEVQTANTARGNFDTAMANAIVDVATAAKTDIEALQGGTISGVIPVANIASRVGIVHSVRGVVTSNIVSLSAFTVATHDGLTFVGGDYVLLTKQSTTSQDGIYLVGTVTTGTAPLTRAADWALAMVLPANSVVKVNEGMVFRNSTWFVSLAGAITVGTSSPAFYPERVKGTTVAMTAGAVTVLSTWILSTSTSVVMLTPKTPGGTQGNLSYGTLTAGAGSGAFTITSDGGSDTSTISYVIEN